MEPGPDHAISAPHAYEVCIRGELSDLLVRELGATRRQPSTTVVVPTLDQADLHSVIRRVEDLGLELLSIHELSDPAGDPADDPARTQT
jgi:cell division FtsZ-interacting protein ZapD